jgi:hypothetical protein
MKALFQITSEEYGTVLLRRRKIAKALRWWLHRNGINYKSAFIPSGRFPETGRKRYE